MLLFGLKYSLIFFLSELMQYSFRVLCGVGVSLKIVTSLC